MQKIVQRRLAAQNQALRRAQRTDGKLESAQAWNSRYQLASIQKTKARYFKEEKHRRREEYETGPQLAPRRDTGDLVHSYGTIDPIIIQHPKLHWSLHKDFKSPFAQGDRVLIVKGKDAGKIAEVNDIQPESATMTLDKLRRADFHVPSYMRDPQDPRSIVPQALHVPWADAKLVYPLRDQTTGHFEDVVVDKIELKNAGWRKDKNGKTEYVKGQRYLPGIKTPLSWPKQEHPPKHEGYDDDTLRITVNDITHRPYLLQPPMPPSVIDELRNKYSKYRTRHEDWYVAEKLQQDAALSRKQRLAQLVSTPMAELKEKRRQQVLANPPTLTEEQLARIGQVMAQSKLDAVREVATRDQQ